MKVQEFMKLPDNEKGNYFNRVYDNNDYDDFDIEVFTAKQLQFTEINTPHCEMCDSLEQKYIGTPDTREPKFCFRHYQEINSTSDFVLV